MRLESAAKSLARQRRTALTARVDSYHPMDSFDEASAAQYDDEPRGDEDAAVAFLHELAGDGRALELAIGTGRIGLPLAARGIRVDGIDMSEPMVARLRAKPGGAELAVTMGDFADVAVDGRYSLIYVVYNTFFNLLTQDDQVRCFGNVAAHLAEDGRFVIEASVPSWLYRLRDYQYVDAEAVRVDGVVLDTARYDPVTQLLEETHVVLGAGQGVQCFPIVTRQVWPSELDLMARLAGLRLHERWGGWSREPYTGDSRLAVSVFGR
jgi:SAM-dependent methyltransferase